MTHITVGLNPSQTINVVSQGTLWETYIDTLYLTSDYVYAANGSGTQRVYPTRNMTDWPAWLVAVWTTEAQQMNKVESTDVLTPGMVILSGTAYYKVEGTSLRTFLGRIWDESSKGWGALKDVPLPSPTTAAYVVPASAVARLFPVGEGK